MKRLQAFKFELMPNGEQQRAMRRFAGSCRFVYNKALALQQSNHKTGVEFIGYVAMAKHLTEWRNGLETPWLKDAPVHPLQHALKDLERAYKNFFAKRSDFPRFKRKDDTQCFRYPDAKQFEIDQRFDPEHQFLSLISRFHRLGCELCDCSHKRDRCRNYFLRRGVEK